MCLVVWTRNGILSGKNVDISKAFKTRAQKDDFRHSAKEKGYLYTPNTSGRVYINIFLSVKFILVFYMLFCIELSIENI